MVSKIHSNIIFRCVKSRKTWYDNFHSRKEYQTVAFLSMMPLARRWMVERDNLAPYVGQPRIYPLFSGSHAFSCHHIAKHGNTLFHNMSFKNYQRSTSGTKDQFQSILPTKGDTCSLCEKTSITDHKRIISKIFCHSRFLGIRKDSRRFIEVILKGDCKGNPKEDQI